ncbi:hypothetical protein SAMN06298226_1626 [Nitrosovibrio sp. Nv4]|nr:hypothetical protein SAMN06298226_1626 [Nitrosovibrio sp. Nv4]
MGGLFSSPKLPAPEPVPDPPDLEDKAAQAASDEERRRRGNSGRASNIFTNPLGEEDGPAKKFLGA